MNKFKMTMVVGDLSDLIEKYGLDAIRHTLAFIENFPSSITFSYKEYYSDQGTVVSLTPVQFAELRRQYENGKCKIQAIKWLRELTSIGLKEAKDAVEYWDKDLRY
jgi:valyl-tRNA synthetase